VLESNTKEPNARAPSVNMTPLRYQRSGVLVETADIVPAVMDSGGVGRAGRQGKQNTGAQELYRSDRIREGRKRSQDVYVRFPIL